MSAKEQLVLPFPGGSFPPAEEGKSGLRNDGYVSESEPRGKGGDAPAHPIPQDRHELALAIFAQCNPVALGCAILQNGEDRGASVRLRALEMFTDWAYGKDEDPDPGPTRVIWDLPRRGDGASGEDSESAEGGGR